MITLLTVQYCIAIKHNQSEKVLIIRAQINCFSTAGNHSWLCIQADLLHSPECYMGGRHLHWQGLLFCCFFISISPVFNGFPPEASCMSSQGSTCTAMRYWGNTVNCWCHAIKEVLFIFAVHNVQEMQYFRSNLQPLH